MTLKILNASYLRVQRNFPQDSTQALSVELDRMYTDVAASVNDRMIGIFALGSQTINGEAWFFTGQRQQAIRNVYNFDDSTLTQNHNIDFSNVSYFSRIWGTFQDGSGNWNTLPYTDVSDVTNQVNIVISSIQIIVTKGAGSPPTISNGLIVLEYIING